MNWNWLTNLLNPEPKLGKLGVLFNEYTEAFASLTQETDRDLVIDAGRVVYYLYGSEKRKNEAWAKEHGGTGSIYFMNVSSNPIKVIGDVREVRSGKHKGRLVINKLSLGHEDVHSLRVIMSNWTLNNEDDGELLSPDKYLNI